MQILGHVILHSASLCTLFGTKCRTLRHGGGGGAAAAAAAAAVAVAVTPVLGRLALAVPRGGVVRLKRDIAPLSATQLVALLREAGADNG